MAVGFEVPIAYGRGYRFHLRRASPQSWEGDAPYNWTLSRLLGRGDGLHVVPVGLLGALQRLRALMAPTTTAPGPS